MTLADEMYELARWLHESDPGWHLSPQAHAQFIIDILRNHGHELSKKVVVGDRSVQWVSPEQPETAVQWYERNLR